MRTDKLKRILISLVTIIMALLTPISVMADDSVTITFYSGSGGSFSGGSTTNTVVYVGANQHIEKYSHTENIDDTGLKSSNYGNSWTNSNIRGTDRTSANSNAHVVTIDGASELTVDLYFNGESISWDWVSVFAGNYPSYTAYDNYSSTGAVTQAMGAPNSTNKYGGSSLSGVTFGTYTVNGNTLTNMGHVTLTIPGDTVTFAFRSDGSGCGQGYGYYAIISADVRQTLSGTYKEPTANDPLYKFDSWNSSSDGSGSTVDIKNVTSSTQVYAKYVENLIDSGTYGSCAWKLRGNGTLEIGTSGQACTLSSTSSYSGWPWYSNRDQVTNVVFNGNVSTSAQANGMFYGMSNLTSLDLSSLNMSSTTAMNNFLNGDRNLTDLVLPTSTGALTDTSSMFYGCNGLKSLDISGLNTRDVVNAYRTFYGCTGLTSLTLGNFASGGKATDLSQLFYNCNELSQLDVSRIDVSQTTTMSNMFNGCSNLTQLDVSGFRPSLCTYFNGMFSYCSRLTSLDLSDMATPAATEMESMFYGCSSLTELDISGLTTDKVTRMNQMFRGCSKLTSVDLSTMDMQKVTNLSYMFYGDTGISSLDFSAVNTPALTNMSCMFYGMSNLENIDLSGLDTAKVTNMSLLFYNDSKLATLDLSNFDTSKVTDISGMFSGMSGLKSVYLPSTYRFNGNGSVASSSSAVLPTPSSPATGWKQVYNEATMSKVEGQTYTPADLRDNWDPSTMAGLWVWDTESINSSGYNDSENRQSSKSGNWTQLSEDVWKYTFDVFDDSQDYYLQEDIIPGFTSDIDPTSGYIRVQNKEATITNTTDTQLGSLTVLKTTSNNTTEKFPITITLSGQGIPSGTKIIDDIVFKDGVATIYLGKNESRTINNIVEGVAYSVTEEEQPLYSTTITNGSGYIIKEGTTVTVNNTYTYVPPASRSLTVSKKVNSQADLSDYSFTAYLEGLAPGISYSLTKTGSAAQQFTADSNGRASVDFTLKANESIVLNDLPVGSTYQISEKAGRYISSYSISDTGSGSIAKVSDANTKPNINLSTAVETVDAGESATVEFTNTLKKYEDLLIELVVESGPEDYEFTVDVEFSNLEPGEAYNSGIGRIVADDEGSATKSFHMKHGDLLKFHQLPVGASYKFTENKSGYIVNYEITDANSKGAIIKPADENDKANTPLSTSVESIEEDELVTVKFINNMEDKTIKVIKIWEDEDNFFGLRPDDIELHVLANNVESEYEDITDWYKNGNTWSKELLVPDTNTDNLKVYEGSVSPYTSSASSSTSAAVVTDGEATITNTLATRSVVVSKIWIDDTADDRPNDITLHLGHYEGTTLVEDAVSKRGISTVKNGNTWLVSMKLLDSNTDYYVWEDAVDNYISTNLSDNPVHIVENVAQMTNEYQPLKTITVSKHVGGNMGNKNDKFQFTLTGDDKIDQATATLNGEPYELTGTGNTRTFTLGHDDTIVITTRSKIEYTVEENDYSSKGYHTYLNGGVVEARSTSFTLSTDRNIRFDNTIGASIPTGINLTAKYGLWFMIIPGLYMLARKAKKKKDH